MNDEWTELIGQSIFEDNFSTYIDFAQAEQEAVLTLDMLDKAIDSMRIIPDIQHYYVDSEGNIITNSDSTNNCIGYWNSIPIVSFDEAKDEPNLAEEIVQGWIDEAKRELDDKV